MPYKPYVILNALQIEHKLRRIAHQILEDNLTEEEVVLAGIFDNGYRIAKRLESILNAVAPFKVSLMKINIDRACSSLNASCDKDLETCSHKVIVLVDDVLNSGRTLAYGFGVFLNIPIKKIRTTVLINRSHRCFPISVDFSGLDLSTILKEHIQVIIDEPNTEDVVYLQ